MARRNFGKVTGSCSVCTINLWDSCDGKPAIFPCNLKGCPYEDASVQNKQSFDESLTSSGLSHIL